MVQDESSNALLRLGAFVEPGRKLFEDGGESMFLNQVQQTFLRSEVMIQAGQRHARGPREVAHGSAFISFFAKDFGSVRQHFAEATVETSIRDGAGGTTWTSGSATDCGARH